MNTPVVSSSALRGFLYSTRVFSLLQPYDCGWLDGGCLILADALIDWLGDQAEALMVVSRGQPGAHHALVRCNGWLLDGDGVTTEEQLLRRWEYVERVPHPRLEPLQRDALLACGTPQDRALSDALAWWLGQRFPAQACSAQRAIP